MSNFIVAIDGHSGCGKSSTAKEVARRLEFTYIDSGAMYRAATLFLMRLNILPEETEKILHVLSKINVDFGKNEDGQWITFLNGENVEKEIRGMKVTGLVSQYSRVPELRRAMVQIQQKLSEKTNVVMDGRDIGTVVFPDADLKIFMTADLKVRAQRRQQELLEQGRNEDLNLVIENLKSRDETDSNRESSPLVQAEDAVVVDTTNLTLEEQVEMVANLVRRKIAAKPKK